MLGFHSDLNDAAAARHVAGEEDGIDLKKKLCKPPK